MDQSHAVWEVFYLWSLKFCLLWIWCNYLVFSQTKHILFPLIDLLSCFWLVCPLVAIFIFAIKFEKQSCLMFHCCLSPHKHFSSCSNVIFISLFNFHLSCCQVPPGILAPLWPGCACDTAASRPNCATSPSEWSTHPWRDYFHDLLPASQTALTGFYVCAKHWFSTVEISKHP